MGRRRVAVVLITWNSAGYLPRCCEGIAALRDVEVELVHVDNASTDDTVNVVASRLPHARQIVNQTNRGFAPAANQGIDATTAEWVLLVNPDLFVMPDYAARAIEALEDAGERFGAATGKLRKASGREIEPTALVDSKGIRMTRSGRHFDIDNGLPDRPDERREVFGVSGAAALYRRAMLDDVRIDGEVFDERFFTYREDADLAWRSRLAGWRALYVPEAEALHVRLVTPAARRSLAATLNMHSVKNRFLLRLNNEGIGLALRNLPWELSRDLVVIGACLTIERSSLPAFAWLWQHRREILDRRRAVQKKRRVSDGELARWFE